MQSSSDLSKIILKSIIEATTETGYNVVQFLNKATAKDAVQRLQYLRIKANGTNKLTVDQIITFNEELIAVNDKSNLETPMWKFVTNMFRSTASTTMDSNGNVDLTEFIGGYMIFHKIPFMDKILMLFSVIDQNGDGSLSREEVTKFFSIILANTLNILKSVAVNFSHYGVDSKQAQRLQENMPEFEKILDHAKVPRLVEGAFKADIKHHGLITLEEWKNWMETGNFKEQWGTISLLFNI